MAAGQRFVFDTSAFTGVVGTKGEIDRAIERLVSLVARAKKAGISCYTPPSVWAELKGMLERKNTPASLINRLDAWLIQKAPSRYELSVPAEFIYEYVGEVRERFNRGLREAEKAVLKLHHGQESHEKIIGELRDKYKTVIRQGLVDSQEDLDVLMLAKELGAGIVARDEGLLSWARKWGIRFLDAKVFAKLVNEYKGAGNGKRKARR
ncbi:RNA ligase partner protein [Candidatus Micrarchaeota archaeon]|nr:RNA ligase partner protein [Candidatus Micrarchaeota archaeon]